MRPIKFRVWEKMNKMMLKIDSVDWKDGHPYFTDDIYIPMQYTGLKDKNGNGKEIYEGDIVEFEEPQMESGMRIAKIIFEDGCFLADVLYYDANFKDNNSESEKYSLSIINSLEIIGNIMENKELLK